MRVYVFSRTLRPEAYPGATVVSENASDVVAGLRAEPGSGEIWLFGGGQLFSSLLVGGQVDLVELTIVPVLLGGGIPLVGSGINRTQLQLLKTHRYPTGMVSLSYAVAPRAV
jgi:dihydrofolate reductase